MPRLNTLKPQLSVLNTNKLSSLKVSDRRLTGWRLVQRRKRLWAANPCCAMCGRLTEYPHGFELDHITPLYLGGEDTESNCQILCCGEDGCHRKKTNADLKR